MSSNNKKICPACEKTFICKATDDASCWCTQLPPILPADEDSQCLCPHCLSVRIKTKLNDEPEKAAPYLKKAAKQVMSGIPNLQEDLDYYINDEGNWVFTTFYHLRKGYCCQNGCKHCPYGFKK